MVHDSLSYQSLETQAVFQVDALKKTLGYVSEHSTFYKKMFEPKSVAIDSINSLKDLELLPTTNKEDLQLYNEDFLCVSKNKIIEYSATSGTMGNPVYVALTENDLERLAYNEWLSFQLMQLNEEDVVQLMLTLDRQFMAGMAYYSGLKRLGAGIVRTGPGLPPMQLDVAAKLKSNVLVAVPSFLLKLIEYAQQHAISLSGLGIKKVLCIGENIRNQDFELNTLSKHISKHWDLQLYGTYACTEMQTAFTECEYGVGGHHQPELVIVEILDENGKQLPAGEYGEITITTLGVEGMPLVRFRTGDISCYLDSPCACGRKTIRLAPIAGRKKQMIKYKGTTLYPSTIFDLLNHFPNIKEYVVEAYLNEMGNDELILHIATDLTVDECEIKLRPFLQSRLRIIPKVQYHTTHEILLMQNPNGNRKPLKFIDNRK